MVRECPGGCPFQETLDLLGRRYALSVLWALQRESPRRFNDMKRQLGVNPVTLSQRLQELADAGIVTRTEFAGTPPRVEYTLTPKGHDLLPLIEGLERWAERHEGKPAKPPVPPSPPAPPSPPSMAAR